MKESPLSPQELLGLFYQAPYAQGLLVFNGGEYEGVVFKKDIERNLHLKNFSLRAFLQPLSFSQLEEFLFAKEPTPRLTIPVVLSDRETYRFITYQEFRWHFHPEEFPMGIIEQVIQVLDHPLVVCSSFRRVLYQNKKAFELFEADLLGKNLSSALRQWALEEKEGFFLVYSDRGRYRLFISQAEEKNFFLLVFQFFPLG